MRHGALRVIGITGSVVCPAVLLAVTLTGQTTTPSFEVASVKPSNSGGGSFFRVQPNQRLTITNMPMSDIIAFAYQLRPGDFRLVGLPAWARTARFDIVAKGQDGAQFGSFGPMAGPPGPGTLMLRALLADRFQLKIHSETRELPIYALVIARPDKKLGPKMTASNVDCDRLRAERLARGEPPPPPAARPGEVAPCSRWQFRPRIAFGSQPISALTDYLSMTTNRVVVDRTGLTGLFDIEMIFTPDQVPPANAPPLPPPPPGLPDINGGVTIDPNGPSLMTAIEEQLGLKLESARGPVEVWVIDSVSQPTPD